VTGSSASAFNASDRVPGGLGVRDVHLWLCARDRVATSDDFKRRVLSRYAAVAPSDWQFSLNAHGKPALAGAIYALDFNLSHSGDWLACAVTAGTPVGVDLEYCHAKRPTMKLARRFFRQEEAEALQVYRGARQRDRFYDFWTLKEAAVKARGEALVPGLQAHGFALNFLPGLERESASIAVTTADVGDGAHYCLLDPMAQYRVAICCLSATPLPPKLQVFELRDKDEGIEMRVSLRASSWLDCAAMTPDVQNSC
jgi:4'-phosphopantetheinyl transferase